jgi:hypothetical protein
MKSYIKIFPRLKFSLLIAGVLSFGFAGTYASGQLNPPSGGYLLCVQPKTHLVTHPISNSCLSGDQTLVLGAQGNAGIYGKDDLNANQILSGNGTPTPALGSRGDFYIDTVNSIWYGPKADTLSTGISLIGQIGATGLQGIQGPAGSAGVSGLTGSNGASLLMGVGAPSNDLGKIWRFLY